MAWYQEKKLLDSKDISEKENFEEDSSLQAYFVYAIVMSVVTVSPLPYYHRCRNRRKYCKRKKYSNFFPVGDHSTDRFSDEKKDSFGDAALSRSWKGSLLDARSTSPTDLCKYILYQFLRVHRSSAYWKKDHRFDRRTCSLAWACSLGFIACSGSKAPVPFIKIKRGFTLGRMLCW